MDSFFKPVRGSSHPSPFNRSANSKKRKRGEAFKELKGGQGKKNSYPKTSEVGNTNKSLPLGHPSKKLPQPKHAPVDIPTDDSEEDEGDDDDEVDSGEKSTYKKAKVSVFEKYEDIPTDVEDSDEIDEEEEEEEEEVGDGSVGDDSEVEEAEDDDKGDDGEDEEDMKHLSFEEIEALKKEASNMLAINDKDNHSNKYRKRRPSRVDKNAPTAQSSKRAVSRHREVIAASANKTRDPRFDPLCGRMDDNAFNNRYGFIKDIRKSEIDELKNVLKPKKSKSKGSTKLPGGGKLTEEMREEMKAKLVALQQVQAIDMKKSKERELKSSFMKSEKGRVADGKTPFFPKRSLLKEMELTEKYKELESKGQLEKFIAKRRKKNTSKDRRWLPTRR